MHQMINIYEIITYLSFALCINIVSLAVVIYSLSCIAVHVLTYLQHKNYPTWTNANRYTQKKVIHPLIITTAIIATAICMTQNINPTSNINPLSLFLYIYTGYLIATITAKFTKNTKVITKLRGNIYRYIITPISFATIIVGYIALPATPSHQANYSATSDHQKYIHVQKI